MKKYKQCCGRGRSETLQAAPPPAELGRLAELMNGGRYAEAGEIAGALANHHPHLGFLWKVYGVALLRQAKDASPMLQRAIQLSPDDADAHYYLGTALHGRGDVAGAIVRFQQAIALRPAYTVAILDLADAQLHCGRFLEATAGYRRALEIEPELAEVHNNLGNALHGAGQLGEAVTSFRRALAIKPHFAEAHSNLGNALRGLGLLRDALASYRHALAVKPDFAQAHNNIGNALRDLGRLDDAVTSYRRALDINPNFAEAHSNLGNALRDLGRLYQALASYRCALEIEPQLAEAHNNLGNVLLDLMQLSEAAASYRQALALRPGYVHAHTALAMVLRLQGRAAAAEASCRRALEIAPNSAESIAFLAEIHADRGDFAEADALLKRALDIDPELPAAWAGIAHYRRMEGGDPAWLAAAQRLASKNLPLRHQIYLRFAIGKYFDDAKAYEQAFHSYRLANELSKNYGATYDRSRSTGQVDHITDAYDQQWLRQAPIQSARSNRPIFVVGMPRSGTTLAEQILASHPAVFGAGELPFWNDAAAAYESSTYNAQGRSTITAFAQEYLQQLAELSTDAARVVDKMPTNYLHLGLIHAALPNARIIHMRRNPIDTCLSIYFQNFSISHAYANDLEDLAHFYTEYHRVMAHWRATLPEGTMLDVSYEGLVEDQEAWSRKMIEFVDLPWDTRCLDFHKTARAVITPSKWQVRQRMSNRSSGRWRNYEGVIGSLKRLLKLTEFQ
jgi:tetratricopeptide (TPR) repeat protein